MGSPRKHIVTEVCASMRSWLCHMVCVGIQGVRCTATRHADGSKHSQEARDEQCPSGGSKNFQAFKVYVF